MKSIVAEFTDNLGRKRVIHRDRRNRFAVKRLGATVPLSFNRAIGPLVGKKIRAERLRAGLTLEQLALKAGLVSVTPKSRMYEIEKGPRGESIHFGTLYAIAYALSVSPKSLLPTMQEVMAHTNGVGVESIERLVVNGGEARGGLD